MSTLQAIIDQSGTSVVDAAHPWPGLFAFTEGQSDYFYGRNEEIDELFRRVKRDTITILYSKSGLGKTSVLRAGLCPRLQKASFLPVYIRLKYDVTAGSLESQVKIALKQAIDKKEDLAEVTPPVSEESLWEYLHHRGGNLLDHDGNVICPVLIFDQFEEIFTLGLESEVARGLREEFLECFADLVENKKPQRLNELLIDNPRLAAQFDFATIACKIVISFREEYVARLDDLRKIPSLSAASRRMNIKELDGGKALQAVSRPNPELVSREVSELIVRFVARDTGKRPLPELEVAPAILSLFCRELSLKRGDEPQITSDLVKGGADTIIDDFYKRYVDNKPEPLQHLIEDELVVSGYRDNIDLAEAKRKLEAAGVSGAALDELVNDRVLHVEDFRGKPRLELTHDVLLEPVKRRREQRRQKEALDEEKRQRAEAELRIEEEKRQRADAERRADAEARAAKRLRILVGALVVALVCAGVAVWMALKEKRKADRERVHALEQRQIAKSESERAEHNSQLALAQELVQAATAANLRYQFKLGALLASQAMPIAVSSGPPALVSDAETVMRTALTAVDATLIEGFEGVVADMSWSPDGSRIAVLDGKTLQVRDTRTGRQLFKEDNDAKAVSWSPNGKWLAVAGSDGLGLRDARTLKVLRSSDDVRAPVAWHPNPKIARFASSSDEDDVHIWQAPDLKEIADWSAADKDIDGIAWSPEGDQIATSSEDAMLRVWDAANGRRLLNIKAYAPPSIFASDDSEDTSLPQVKWSPDGKRLLTTDFFLPLDVREARTGKVIQSFKGPTVSMNMADWSHNGKWLALDSPMQQDLKILDGNAKDLFVQIPSPESLAWIKWDATDSRVAVATITKQVVIYKTDALGAQTPTDLLNLARAKVKENLTAAECKQYLHMDSCPPRP